MMAKELKKEQDTSAHLERMKKNKGKADEWTKRSRSPCRAAERRSRSWS